MDHSLTRRLNSRKMRTFRVRNSLRGNDSKPRLSVSKTNTHLFVQLIDDEKGVTIGGIGTLSKANKKTKFNRKSKESARHLGGQIAEIAKKNQIERVVFDRGPNKYHGVIAELADAARSAGLQF